MATPTPVTSINQNIPLSLERLIASCLERRRRGALFALDPRNPDASRHFLHERSRNLHRHPGTACSRRRRVPGVSDCPKTDTGRPTRRARIQFALHQKGLLTAPLEQFIDDDVDDIVALFKLFNTGTDGEAANIAFSSLVAIKDARGRRNRVPEPRVCVSYSDSFVRRASWPSVGALS